MIWRTTALTLALLIGTAGCGGDDDDEGGDSGGHSVQTPEAFGAPADAEAVETPEGETIYLADSTLYGPCDVLEPHDGEFAEWLGLDPSPMADFGFACIG